MVSRVELYNKVWFGCKSTEKRLLHGQRKLHESGMSMRRMFARREETPSLVNIEYSFAQNVNAVRQNIRAVYSARFWPTQVITPRLNYSLQIFCQSCHFWRFSSSNAFSAVFALGNLFCAPFRPKVAGPS